MVDGGWKAGESFQTTDYSQVDTKLKFAESNKNFCWKIAKSFSSLVGSWFDAGGILAKIAKIW